MPSVKQLVITAELVSMATLIGIRKGAQARKSGKEERKRRAEKKRSRRVLSANRFTKKFSLDLIPLPRIFTFSYLQCW